jgi:hypothetical protein
MARALAVERPTPEDLISFPLRPELEPDGFMRFLLAEPAYREMVHVYSRIFRCPCHTEPLAIVGVTPIFLHTAEIWAFLSSQVTILSHAGMLMATLRKLEPQVVRTLSLQRLQAVADTKLPGARSFAEHEGFQVEGILRNYRADGRDFYRLAKLYPRGPR